jgi:hypothetical protein
MRLRFNQRLRWGHHRRGRGKPDRAGRNRAAGLLGEGQQRKRSGRRTHCLLAGGLRWRQCDAGQFADRCAGNRTGGCHPRHPARLSGGSRLGVRIWRGGLHSDRRGGPADAVREVGSVVRWESQPVLPQNLQVKVTDQYNNPASGQSVSWALTGWQHLGGQQHDRVRRTASVVHARRGRAPPRLPQQ